MKAVFLDRDGVLNEDVHYLYRVEDFTWVQGAREAVAYLNHLGYAVIVVTNQSGVARGYYTEDDVRALHDWMCGEIEKAGGHITAVYYCPYLEGATVKEYDRKSDWRKPAPGMVLQAAADFGINLKESFMIGDGQRDVDCAVAAGMEGYLFTGGRLDTFVKSVIRERTDDESLQ